jgi:hypothetical protein
MNRRTALAAAAAVSLSITGLDAAAGATMQVFDAADASPNVGKVSPVTPSTTRAPEVEHHVVVVTDPPEQPAPAAAAPVGVASRGSEGTESHTSPETHPVTAAPAPAAPTPPSGPFEREMGDD